MALTEEVHNLKKNQQIQNESSIQRDVFLPLESTTEYHYRSRVVLEDMSEQQYKLFHVSIN
jgi:hypothetical protein